LGQGIPGSLNVERRCQSEGCFPVGLGDGFVIAVLAVVAKAAGEAVCRRRIDEARWDSKVEWVLTGTRVRYWAT
jgi:hypothetical protein